MLSKLELLISILNCAPAHPYSFCHQSAFGIFDGRHCGHMLYSNGLECLKQSSMGFVVKDGLRIGNLLLRSASSNIACSAPISDVSCGVEVMSLIWTCHQKVSHLFPKPLKTSTKEMMVVVADDDDRENEGDLIMAASKVTPEAMAFFVKHGTGIVCVSMKSEDLERLQLPLMVNQRENEEKLCTSFTISVDVKHGTSTGVSACDRAITCFKRFKA